MKLYNRETSYYTIITIPKCLVSKYGKKQIWRSLNTKDYKLAKLRAELETMSIRRKLLNDLNKQKEKTSIRKSNYYQRNFKEQKAAKTRYDLI